MSHLLPPTKKLHAHTYNTTASLCTRNLACSTFTFALSVATNPVVVRNSLVSLPLAKQFNSTGVFHVLERDQDRAKTLAAFGARKAALKQGPGTVPPFRIDTGILRPTNNCIADYVIDVSLRCKAQPIIADHDIIL